MATIFFLDVLFMFSMFGLNVTYPGNDGEGWIRDVMRVNNDLHGPYNNSLVGMQTKRLPKRFSRRRAQHSVNTNLILRQRAVVPTREFMLIRTFGPQTGRYLKRDV